MGEEDMAPRDYAKMRVGIRTVDNALVNLGTYKKVNPNYGDKGFVLNAIYRHDYKTLREISEYFFESSGIYYRLCKYLATLYRYDWYVTPYFTDVSKEKKIRFLVTSQRYYCTLIDLTLSDYAEILLSIL